jgi:type IV secretory pathway component VirB8
MTISANHRSLSLSRASHVRSLNRHADRLMTIYLVAMLLGALSLALAACVTKLDANATYTVTMKKDLTRLVSSVDTANERH